MVKVIFKNGEERLTDKKTFALIMGIKNAKNQIFTYQFL